MSCERKEPCTTTTRKTAGSPPSTGARCVTPPTNRMASLPRSSPGYNNDVVSNPHPMKPLAPREGTPNEGGRPMFPCRLIPVAVLALVAGAPVRAADLHPLVPADTETYVAVNVRQVLDSELFKKQLLAPLKQMIQDIGGDKLKE